MGRNFTREYLGLLQRSQSRLRNLLAHKDQQASARMHKSFQPSSIVVSQAANVGEHHRAIAIEPWKPASVLPHNSLRLERPHTPAHFLAANADARLR